MYFFLKNNKKVLQRLFVWKSYNDFEHITRQSVRIASFEKKPTRKSIVMLTVKCHIGLSAVKSRRNDTLLIVDLIYGKRATCAYCKVPQGRYSSLYKCRPCGWDVKNVNFIKKKCVQKIILPKTLILQKAP